MRICFWKDGGSENESNQVVILAINLRLRNRCKKAKKAGRSALKRRARWQRIQRRAATTGAFTGSAADGMVVTRDRKSVV